MIDLLPTKSIIHKTQVTTKNKYWLLKYYLLSWEKGTPTRAFRHLVSV